MNQPRDDRQSQMITLNFLPCAPQDFTVMAYRQACDSAQAIPASDDMPIKRYRLPVTIGEQESEYEQYNVSFAPIAGYEQFECGLSANNYLSLHYLYLCLLERCRNVLDASEFEFEGQRFRSRIDFPLYCDALGTDNVWLEPYYLQAEQRFGFLIGFHFSSNSETVNREILQRSLSLGQDGRENKDFYADHYLKCEEFRQRYMGRLFPVQLTNGRMLNLNWPPLALQTAQLEAKTYVLAGERSSKSQFMGLKSHGPYERPAGSPVVCFMYRPEDKSLAYDLYYALKGQRFQTFPGMSKMFSLDLAREDVLGIAVDNFTSEGLEPSIRSALSQAAAKPLLPVVVFPWSRQDHDADSEDRYYTAKHCFLKHKLPTQFVSIAKLSDSNAFKWSVSNIALAMFGKLGGKPWKVEPRHAKCLIIGVGQSHRRNAEGRITRYFAYSVLTDSSGLYETIRVLARSDDRDAYLQELMNGIDGVISTHCQDYDTFVVHTPFSLRKDEMNQVHAALDRFQTRDGGSKQFVVMKFNEHNKFMGFALWNNSRVPYESTYVRLGRGEYLVWFEGLQYHNPTVKRRIAKPMHIEFTYPVGGLNREEEAGFLQDAVNLSGANWRGFNAKSLPVSVYYAKLISDYIGHFDQLGFAELDVEDLPPWFL